jgi:hypothetical protein
MHTQSFGSRHELLRLQNPFIAIQTEINLISQKNI